METRSFYYGANLGMRCLPKSIVIARLVVMVATAILLAACGDTGAPTAASDTTQAESSPSASESASSSASAATSPTPIQSPSSAPAPIVVAFVNAPLTAARGSNATLQVKTAPNTSCSIEVEYKSGPSTAAGLVSKNSDGAGKVSWTWKVGANTTRGAWPITVTCGDGSAQTHITVT